MLYSINDPWGNIVMNSCHAIRDDLASCLLRSDCVQSGKSGQECLQNHMAELPADCQAIYKSYVHCRRGLLDMRKRFRGNAPPSAASNRAPGGTTTIGTNDPAQTLNPDQVS